MELTFRNITSGEASKVLCLYRSLLGTEGCVWNEEYPCEETVRYDLERDALFCLENEAGEPVGVISIDDDPEVEKLECWSEAGAPGAELSRLGVSLEYQNRGIAGMLLHNGMKELERRGYKSVHFLVAKDNARAINAYKKFSFDVVGETFLFGHEYWCYEKIFAGSRE